MIGERTPHSCRFLSKLAPQYPSNLRLLPETVRSGTGSYPKPPAHGSESDRTNFGFRKEAAFDDPKVKLTGVGLVPAPVFSLQREMSTPLRQSPGAIALPR